MSMTKLRAALRERFGARRYRVTRGEVHAYGAMPNSIVTGWYFVGYIADIARNIQEA